MKTICKTCLLAAGILALGHSVTAQETEINDMTTPLHLLRPEYKVPYGDLTAEQVKTDIDRVFAYIEQHTPVRVLDADGKEVTDYRHIPHGATLDRGAFRIGSYEWGVTYQALLDAAEVTGDDRYKDYVVRRFKFLAEVAPGFRKLYEQYKDTDAQMEQILHPKALDDAGAMCCAMMKARIADPSLPLSDLIENYFAFIEHGQYRLPDGTFARHRPQHNTIWLDDSSWESLLWLIVAFIKRRNLQDISTRRPRSADSSSTACLSRKRGFTVTATWKDWRSSPPSIGHVPTDGP